MPSVRNAARMWPQTARMKRARDGDVWTRLRDYADLVILDLDFLTLLSTGVCSVKEYLI